MRTEESGAKSAFLPSSFLFPPSSVFFPPSSVLPPHSFSRTVDSGMPDTIIRSMSDPESGLLVMEARMACAHTALDGREVD
jgi:hypothetical protein